MDQIFHLIITEQHQASLVLKLQREAYQVEADLIGFREIPPLKESLQELMRSDEIFLGYGNTEFLSGFIALEKNTPRQMTISRLCVLPSEFRKGIASGLLTAAFTTYPEISTFRVTTGAANTPATNFYIRSGFAPAGFQWVADGRLQIACFVYSC